MPDDDLTDPDTPATRVRIIRPAGMTYERAMEIAARAIDNPTWAPITSNAVQARRKPHRPATPD